MLSYFYPITMISLERTTLTILSSFDVDVARIRRTRIRRHAPECINNISYLVSFLYAYLFFYMLLYIYHSFITVLSLIKMFPFFPSSSERAATSIIVVALVALIVNENYYRFYCTLAICYVAYVIMTITGNHLT